MGDVCSPVPGFVSSVVKMSPDGHSWCWLRDCEGHCCHEQSYPCLVVASVPYFCVAPAGSGCRATGQAYGLLL